MRVRFKLKQRNILSDRMVIVQAPKRKEVPHGRKLSTYEMGMEVPHSIYAEISEKNNLESTKKRISGKSSELCVKEGSRNHRGKYDASSYTHLGAYPAENERVGFYGVSWKKCNDDIRETRELKAWEQKFLGSRKSRKNSRNEYVNSAKIYSGTG